MYIIIWWPEWRGRCNSLWTGGSGVRTTVEGKDFPHPSGPAPRATQSPVLLV